jgi:hypothetical protein
MDPGAGTNQETPSQGTPQASQGAPAASAGGGSGPSGERAGPSGLGQPVHAGLPPLGNSALASMDDMSDTASTRAIQGDESAVADLAGFAGGAVLDEKLLQASKLRVSCRRP